MLRRRQTTIAITQIFPYIHTLILVAVTSQKFFWIMVAKILGYGTDFSFIKIII